MKFDLNEFDSLNKEEQKKYLIAYGQAFFKTMGVAPAQDDLSKVGVTYVQIRYRFGNLSSYHTACGIDSPIRKRNMSDDEMRAYLKSIVSKNIQHTECPAYARKDPLCYPNCSCWIPEGRYVTEQNRTNIRHKNEMWLLHRLSYFLFKDSLNDNDVMHLCDTPSCFNPDHLRLGTRAENIQQCVNNGRRVHNPKQISDHDLRDPYDSQKLLDLVKNRCEITSKNEWLYKYSLGPSGYPLIMIDSKLYTLSKLILANKLGKSYEDIEITRHLLPDGTEGQRHDLNPDHLIEGSRRDNAIDVVLNKTKLTVEIISYIRDAAPKNILKKGDAQKFDKLMADKFDLPVNTIKNIRLGTSYDVFHNGNAVKINLSTPVCQYDSQGNFLKEYASVADALRTNNFKSKNMIQDVCNGKCKTYMGFIWKYKK